MNLYIAMSCLQGTPDDIALADLVPLAKKTGCTGIQLTPGNAPRLKERLLGALSGLKARTHHSYSAERTVGASWHRKDGVLTFGSPSEGRSIHPPFEREGTLEEACAFFSQSKMLVELPLYTQYLGATYKECMALYEATPFGAAIDVSHLNIALVSGGWTPKQANELLNLPNIKEIHVSANDGRRDQHRPLFDTDYGISWAKERAQDGTPVILECYMHNLEASKKEQQIELILKGT